MNGHLHTAPNLLLEIAFLNVAPGFRLTSRPDALVPWLSLCNFLLSLRGKAGARPTTGSF
jgi:hypothetical protein